MAPDIAGWTSYAMCGHFGADTSPVQGVRLLRPGERVTGRRRDHGGWDIRWQARFAVDDLVQSGIQLRERPLDEAVELAADGLITTANAVDDLYVEPITLGLSGGKDSRLIAASFVAAGQVPNFNTNIDEPAEGETAKVLVDILRQERGVEPEHRLVRVGTKAAVDNMGLRERIRRLQFLYDYQFSSTYLARWPGPERLPAASRPLSLTGAGGELAVGYWYPKTSDTDDADWLTAKAAAMSSLLSAVDPSVAAEGVLGREQARIRALLEHAAGLGLSGLELVDYVYLVERVRRWYSSAYLVGMVTPFLAPGFVAASFALSTQQKREWALHSRLMQRFMPEWTDVPYFTGSTGRSTAARTWEGDGAEVIHALLVSTDGDLSHLLRRDAVAAALAQCVAGAGTLRQERTLQQFAFIAAASQSLEPQGVRTPSHTYAEFVENVSRAPTTGPSVPSKQTAVPAWLSLLAERVRFLKSTSTGRRIWTALRTRLIRGRYKA